MDPISQTQDPSSRSACAPCLRMQIRNDQALVEHYLLSFRDREKEGQTPGGEDAATVQQRHRAGVVARRLQRRRAALESSPLPAVSASTQTDPGGFLGHTTPHHSR